MASGLFSQLISMGMTASWVILVVLAVRLLFQRLRLPKKYSYYLWAVPALRLICPVSVSSAFSLFNVDFIGRKAAGIAAAVEWLAAGGSAAGVAKSAGAGLASGAQGMAQGAGAAANALNAGGTVAAGTAGADIAGAAGNAAGNTGRYGRRYDTEGSGRHHRRKCERGRFAAYSVVGLAGRAGGDSFIQPVLLAAAQKDGTYGGPPSGQCL